MPTTNQRVSHSFKEMTRPNRFTHLTLTQMSNWAHGDLPKRTKELDSYRSILPQTQRMRPRESWSQALSKMNFWATGDSRSKIDTEIKGIFDAYNKYKVAPYKCSRHCYTEPALILIKLTDSKKVWDFLIKI